MRTWEDIQNEVLGLMFSNNTGGSKVTLEDQPVAEYVINMADAFNGAIADLGHIYPVKKRIEVEVNEPYEQKELGKICEGFIRVSDDEVYYHRGSQLVSCGNYDILGEDVFIPHNSGKYTIVCETEPMGVDGETVGEFEIELPDDVISAAVYYMAHRLYLEDDVQIATMYYNIFESKKAELKDYYESRSRSGGGFKKFMSVKGWI